MTLRTEAQITKNWIQNQSPLVSIVCVTYNHEYYISDAIDGFLIQETDFPFEIIIQDDASSDLTPEIIKNYVKKYPSIIKPILQKENQYSQPGKNVFIMAVSHARGKYIACCEGDDYWTDKNKLQIQIGQMQKNPNCDASIHPVMRLDLNKSSKILSQHNKNNKIYGIKEVIFGTAKFCPMASIIFTKDVFNSIPAWFFDAPVGDYFLQILASLKGGVLYINKSMAVYRANAIGSWTEKFSKDENLIYTYFFGMLKSLDDIDLYTDKKFSREFDVIKKKICFFMCINPVLPLIKRKEIFEKNNYRFSFVKKLIWYFLFRNQCITRYIYTLRNYIFE